MKTQTLVNSKHIGLSIVFISIFLIQVFSLNSFSLFPTAQSGISTTSTDQTSQSESSLVNTPALQQVVNSTPIINTDPPILPSTTSSINSLSSGSSISNSYSETIRVDYNNYASKSTSTWQTDYANYNSPSVSTWQTQYTNYASYTAQKVSVSYVYAPITPYFYDCKMYSTTANPVYLNCWWNNNGMLATGGDIASQGFSFSSSSGGGTIWYNIYATLTVPVSLAGGTLSVDDEGWGNWWSSNPSATLYLDSGSGTQYTVQTVPYESYGLVTPTLTSSYWHNPNFLSFRYWMGGAGAEGSQNGNF